MTAVSITLPQFGTLVAPLLDSAVAAEELGFDGVFLVDHLVPLGTPERPVLEMAGCLGAIAASTRRIDLGTLVMRASLRGPRLSALVAVTAETVAPGRVILGLGAGDRASFDEIARFGLENPGFEERLRVLEETVEQVRTATPETPIWIGGRHPRVRDIAGRLADGWNRWAGTPGDMSDELRTIQAGPDFTVSWGGTVVLGSSSGEVQEVLSGRSDSGDVLAGTPEEVAAGLGSWVAAGASHLVLSLLPRSLHTLELFAADVRPRLAG